ncbi:hypothetical protein PAXRUDRAFT_22077 [Paxillus rubicundulus Ve08.2h10]|uniref:Uncharacterized protein n=1 Tax=Paxillus rubicundulus Ve08.2h10 TaxID=930991 RepID=A0A0D0C9V1_9AGAM|nr:hypothetical protein PAXRUDRAFT_22077 [Paxillus rubicundulus Ve08.2h10]
MHNKLLKVDLMPVASLYHHSALYITTLHKLCHALGCLGRPSSSISSVWLDEFCT